MNVYALSDLHLSYETNKPMDVFGEKWENYEDKIKENWNNLVSNEDVVIIAGDISWAMNLNETKKDFEYIDSLNGKKIMIRGNHDYWWKAISSVRDAVPNSIFAIQNDAIKIDNFIFCGTRGWLVPERGKELSAEDKKIYNRELIRLEMSILRAKAMQNEDDKIICVLHFPPFNSELQENEFTALIEKYNIGTVVYGHLHGKIKYPTSLIEKNGVKYYLSSCDKIGFKPLFIDKN